MCPYHAYRSGSEISGKMESNQFHQTNRRRWDAGSASWARRADKRAIWSKCHHDPSLALSSAELRWFQDIGGKSVAVLGSGDNQVVFALAGMRADVTSVDFSKEQLNVARARADVLSLKIGFVQADVVALPMRDESYDFVYAGGHVAVWVSDLGRFYREAARLLKPGAQLIVSEYHPFRRVWKDSQGHLELGHRYFDSGPHRMEVQRDMLPFTPGEWVQFRFHWTVADYIAAILSSGLQLLHAEEFGDSRQDWECAPLTGLPETLLLVGQKARSGTCSSSADPT
jgi:SAM-dependent methyltransferase